MWIGEIAAVESETGEFYLFSHSGPDFWGILHAVEQSADDVFNNGDRLISATVRWEEGDGRSKE